MHHISLNSTDEQLRRARLLNAEKYWKPTDITGVVIKKGYRVKYLELNYTVEDIDFETRELIVSQVGTEPFRIKPVATEIKVVSTNGT